MTAGARLTRRSYLGWETRPVAGAGIRNSDVTGGASGGGVVAFLINDLAPPLFGRPNGVGTGRRSDLLCGLRLRGLRLGSRVRHGLPQRGGRSCHSRWPGCRPAPSGIKESPVKTATGSALNAKRA